MRKIVFFHNGIEISDEKLQDIRGFREHLYLFEDKLNICG